MCDENFKKRLVNVLRALGHDAVRSPIGDEDEEVYARSLKESRIILSNDTDFLDTVKFPLKTTPGRVVFLVYPATFEHQRERMDVLLAEFPIPKKFKGRLVELENDSITARNK